MKKRIWCIIICLFVVNYRLLAGGLENKPHALMTDLIEHTDKIWYNGFITNLCVAQCGVQKEPFQYAQIASDKPTFSWIVPANKNGTCQIAYRIVVAEDVSDIISGAAIKWNSGWIKSAQSVAVPYQGSALQPGKIYFWKVQVETNTGGKSIWSDTKTFKTAVNLSINDISYYPLSKTLDYPKSISSPCRNIFLADFGKDAFGQLSLTLNATCDDDTIFIRFGETLFNGRINRIPGGTIRYSCYKQPLLKGIHTYRIKIFADKRNTSGSAILMPEYIGNVVPFRYCEIEGYSDSLKPQNVVREVVSYPFNDNASSFSCSNDTLNKIWDLCKYSIKATSFTGLYIDGDRERIPYAADALINQLGHYCVDKEYSMARRSFYYILNHPTWPTEWILQTVIIAWYDYLYTGDSKMLLSTYNQLKLSTLMRLKERNGFISTTTGLQTLDFLTSIKSKNKIRDIVDWPNGGHGVNETKGGEADGFVFTDYNAVTNAYFYEAIKLMGQIAKALGKNDDAVFYSSQAEELKIMFNRSFYDKSKGFYKDGISTSHSSLHSNIFPLAFGMVPPQRKQLVLNYIKTRKMACSVYGAQFLLDALYDSGNASDEALKMLTKTDDRSWYNMIRVGSTITLEAWDNKYKPNQDWNHAWGSAPVNIISRKLMGVEPLTPGYSVAQIKPQISTLKWANAIIPTIRGNIELNITNTEKSYSMQLQLPANMQADVYLPLLGSKYKVMDNGKMRDVVRVKNEPFIFLGRVVSGMHKIEVFYNNVTIK